MTGDRKLAAGLVVMAAAPLLMGAAAPDRIGTSALYAVGVTTADADATAREYERVLGVKATTMGVAANATPDGGRNEIRMDVVPLRDFYVKLQQPVSQTGPFAEHLADRGTSIMNFQLHVADAQAVRKRLEGMGQRWVLGSPTDFWGYIDARERLGAILEPIDIRPSLPVNPLPGTTVALGTMPVTRVSLAVADVNKAARSYADLFGIPVPKIRAVRRVEAGAGARSHATRWRVASWLQGEVTIELVQSDNPADAWSDLARSHGNAAIGLDFDAGEKLDAVRRELQDKGGKLLLESADRSMAYYDFRSTLGMVIGVSGVPHGH